VITGGYYESPPDWHWEPPADLRYGFDLQKADQLLTAAGYPLVDGKRVDKQGKPITLRLWARTQSNQSQTSGRLIAGWFTQLGLDIEYQVMDENTIAELIVNTVDGELTPDYDMFLWGWVGELDPNFILSIFLADQIGTWNDSSWSDPTYERLFAEQQTTLDVDKRLQIVHRMQQMLYEQTPYIVLVYPKDIESYNTGSWTGWVRSPEGRGGVVYTTATDSYLLAHAVSQSSSDGGGASLLPILVIAVLLIGVAGWLLLRRRRVRAETEV
jgi:peptide/nickel transport system substrate-binding protein